MSTTTNFKNKILNFIQQANIEGTPSPSSTDPGLWPDTYFVILQNEINTFAKIKAKFNGNQTSINQLQHQKSNGIVPESLQIKFKKLFTKENELQTRTTIINASIDLEIANLTNKNSELNNLFGNRGQSTFTKMQELDSFGFKMDQIYIIPLLDHFIKEKLVQFTFKAKQDLEKKQKKKELFLAKKEAEETAVTITKKQLSNMNNVIKSLQSQIGKLKSNQGKGKELKMKVQSSTPRQKKEEKKETKKTSGRNNGKKRNSANTKRFRGKNGA